MAWFFGQSKDNRKISTLRELADRVETLERRDKMRDIDWIDLLDRVKTLVGRQRKRDARMEVQADPEADDLPGAKPNGLSVSAPDYIHPDETNWSPEMRALNQRIMQRRQRLGG